MKTNISVVINTLNEEKNIGLAIRSVKKYADEIIVVDMHSEDKTVKIAEKLGAKVYFHKKMGYVEPARNYAINKARRKWILILDADETIPSTLGKKLVDIARQKDTDYDHVLIPRKNIIFGKWIQNSRWWPDYNPRFFKRGKIDWPKQIHQKPELIGEIYSLPDEEQYALIHHNYDTLDQFLTRAIRYADVQSDELIKEKKYRLSVADLILKPTGEFLSRFFAGEGYKDGLHGLSLAILQMYSSSLIYLKVWEKQRYEEKNIEEKKIKEIFTRLVYEIEYWHDQWALDRMQGVKKEVWKYVFKTKNALLKVLK
jgi:(heptosyl)LPS beta-1,4-glucosyltransferase